MLVKTQCDGCSREIDFNVEPSGGCFIHKKEYCWKCTKEHICTEGEACRRFFITNPTWMVNLRISDDEN